MSNLNSEANFNEYAKCKNNFELTYERVAADVKNQKQMSMV